MAYQLSIPALLAGLLVLSVLAIVLNSLCIYIIRTSKTLKNKPSALFIINLLVFHLLQGVLVLPLYAGKKMGKKIPSFVVRQVFANGYRFTYILSFYGICLGVLSIALDRFLATYMLRRYKTFVTAKRVSVYLLLLWIYVTILSIIPFIKIEATHKVNKASSNTTTNNSTPTSSQTDEFYVYNHQPEWVVFMLFCNAAVPYLVIIACYVYIVFRLKNIENFKKGSNAPQPAEMKLLSVKYKNKHLVKRSSSTVQKQIVSKYKEVSYLTLALVVTYGVCWTPSIFNYMLWSVCPSCFPNNYEDSKTETILGFIIKYLAYLNALFSPLIYCFYHREFRKSCVRFKGTIFNTESSNRRDATLESSMMISTLT